MTPFPLDWRNQNMWFIKTMAPISQKYAAIYDDEQRATITRLIEHGFYPHHTALRQERCGKKHWSMKKYRGRHGNGFMVISSCPKSSNFNLATYFIRQQTSDRGLYI